MDHSPSAAGSHWLRNAISVIAAMSPASLVHNNACWGTIARQSRPDVKRMVPQYGLHRHDIPEACIVMTGACEIVVEDACYAMDAPALACVSPNRLHAEAHLHQSHPYAMLWLHFCGADRIAATVNRFLPGSGWSLPARYSTRCNIAPLLYERLTADTPLQISEWDRLAADLIGLLNEMHRSEVYAKQRSSPVARATADEHTSIVQHVRDYLDAHYTRVRSVEDVARMTCFSPNYLNTIFTRHVGCGIHRYLKDKRMAKALLLCRAGDRLIKEVAAEVGYSDPLYFSRAYHRHFGHWPSEAMDHAGPPQC